ncbi:MAG: hypothetical protein ABFE07_28490 [Armatimonadia bacterium]
MGTRNLTCVVVDGEYKVAQYGQWDGYPSGQGKTALDFLRRCRSLKKFAEKVRACTWITEEERERRWVEAGAKPKAEWVSIDVGERMNKLYPELNRDLAAGILGRIYKSKQPLQLVNELNFAQDSIFCEWAYVIDLDKGTFEVYEGFNCKPCTKAERFCRPDSVPQKSCDGKKNYYPVGLVKRYSLKKLPTAKQFLKDCAGKED